MQDAIQDLSLKALAQALKDQRVSATQVAEHYLGLAQGHLAPKDPNPLNTPQDHSCGAFVSFNPEHTLAQARASDERIAKGQARAL